MAITVKPFSILVCILATIYFCMIIYSIIWIIRKGIHARRTTDSTSLTIFVSQLIAFVFLFLECGIGVYFHSIFLYIILIFVRSKSKVFTSSPESQTYSNIKMQQQQEKQFQNLE